MRSFFLGSSLAGEAFPKSSGCFQLKSSRTIGSHRGASTVLQVGPRQLRILKRGKDGGKGGG